ncbi:OmpA/MotB family protein [Lacrimispora sp.]|jgi:chemotaxis protein MotB|uniref:OmpA/MotB family protein n=1 Tax=Lacrimispora sp. TaxID=2719234 RepID=UPI0028AC2F35|nr:OmpA family protein [Lacrimispora sp.]
MIKKDRKQEEPGGWLDTYGVIVTLLLCFFILLYSVSYIDQNKWKILVEGVNSSVTEKEGQQVPPMNGTQGDPVSDSAIDAGTITDFGQLNHVLTRVIEERSLQDSVKITSGDDFTFITFHDKVFFDGDSSILRQEGKELLDQFAGVLSRADSTIKGIQVLGHTSQVNPERPNNIRNDRMLSAQRSAEVVIYLQSRNAVSPEKLVSISFGQYRPIAPLGTENGGEINRRVEILITQSNKVEKSLEEYYRQVYHQNQQETDNK